MRIRVNNVSSKVNNQTILNEVDLTIMDGEFVGIIGPNGSGKSTLLKHIYRVLKPNTGQVILNEKHLYQFSPRETALQMAVVRQESHVSFDFRVNEMVLMGRSPHKGMFDSDTLEDDEIVKQALTSVGMENYIDRSFMSLSGGEKQRVLIARALAQQAEILVLDEPTNHLDIHHQLQIMDLAKNLKLTVCAALHDLNIAAMYCDRLYVLKEGKVYISGGPIEVLRSDVIWEVFRVHCDIIIHPITGKVHITFLPERLKNQTESLARTAQ